MNEHIADNCIDSIDKKHLDKFLLIDNSKDGYAQKYGTEYQHYPENIGISRAWNIGAKRVIEQELDYLVIMSATMVFEKGMNDLVAAMEANSSPYGLETQHIWHLICLKRKTLERVGLFDENFYPAYYEDSDYIRRMELTGIHNPMSRTQRLPKAQIAASHQGDAQALKNGLSVNLEACRQYFVYKWGLEPLYDNQQQRDDMFLYPYNNPRYSVDYWHKKSIAQLKEEYGL